MIFLEEILGESNYYFFHQKICNVIDSLVMVKIHMGFFFDVSIQLESILSNNKHFKAICLNFSTILKLILFMHHKMSHFQVCMSLENLN